MMNEKTTDEVWTDDDWNMVNTGSSTLSSYNNPADNHPICGEFPHEIVINGWDYVGWE